jgi:BCCT family betaine/carnitine transporter
VILITAITGVALISVVRGLDGGVKVLSEINMVHGGAAAAVRALRRPDRGHPHRLLHEPSSPIKDLPLSNAVRPRGRRLPPGLDAFYWAWWISWSPFVGMFIARVSRGRTVREFIICVLIIPSIVCVLWMAVFGGTAIDPVRQ